MEVEHQQERMDSREPVTSAVVKPHDMSLDGDLTSHDDVTHQQHLSAKSPMSDDSGVIVDENHMEHNGSVPMTPEGEETRWEEGHQHQSTNGAWPEDDRRDEQSTDTHHHENDAVFTEPAATNVEGVAEETSTLEVARPMADDVAAAAAAEPANDAVITTEHQQPHQPADEAIVEHKTALDESTPSTESECKKTEEVTNEEAPPKEVIETEPTIEAGESKVEEAEPKIEVESKVEEAEPKVEEAESKVEEAEPKVEEAESKVEESTPVEPEEPVDDDKDRVDFVPGVHCDNVMDALSILKNKYRLSRSVSKKNVITFSCWNLKDVTNTPTHVVNANRMSQPVPEEDERMIDILDDILSKEKEIDRLLEQVLEKERENEHKAAEAKRLSAKQGGGGAENDLPVIEETLQAADVATAPALESAPPKASPSPPDQSKEDMKKKRSRLVRMLQALRRRLGGGGGRR